MRDIEHDVLAGQQQRVAFGRTQGKIELLITPDPVLSVIST
ncbi:hypothetical protein ACDH70_02515 [Xanthomonas axonopodis pv. poinsettiicola]|nr:hypothetical protein [Xanthomonas codiaei]